MHLEKNKPNRAIMILLGTNSIILLAGGMLTPIYALFVKRIGGDLLDVGFAASVLAITAGIVVLISGRLSDKIKESEYVMICGYVIMGLGFLYLYFVSSMYQLFLAQILIGIGVAIYSPAFDGLYTKHMNKKFAGTSWSLWEAMNYFVTAVAATIGGFIASQYGFRSLFIIMFVLSMFSAGYLLLLPRKEL